MGCVKCIPGAPFLDELTLNLLQQRHFEYIHSIFNFSVKQCKSKYKLEIIKILKYFTQLTHVGPGNFKGKKLLFQNNNFETLKFLIYEKYKKVAKKEAILPIYN